MSGYARYADTASAPETARLTAAARLYAGWRTASPSIVTP